MINPRCKFANLVAKLKAMIFVLLTIEKAETAGFICFCMYAQDENKNQPGCWKSQWWGLASAGQGEGSTLVWLDKAQKVLSKVID